MALSADPKSEDVKPWPAGQPAILNGLLREIPLGISGVCVWGGYLYTHSYLHSLAFTPVFQMEVNTYVILNRKGFFCSPLSTHTNTYTVARAHRLVLTPLGISKSWLGKLGSGYFP